MNQVKPYRFPFLLPLLYQYRYVLSPRQFWWPSCTKWWNRDYQFTQKVQHLISGLVHSLGWTHFQSPSPPIQNAGQIRQLHFELRLRPDHISQSGLSIRCHLFYLSNLDVSTRAVCYRSTTTNHSHSSCQFWRVLVNPTISIFLASDTGYFSTFLSSSSFKARHRKSARYIHPPQGETHVRSGWWSKSNPA